MRKHLGRGRKQWKSVRERFASHILEPGSDIVSYLIEQPALGLIPALVFLGLYLGTKRRPALIPALLWAGYVPYEFGMKLRILCSGECNIRVDLLLIYPVLAVVSLTALLVSVSALFRKGPSAG
ncbi:MAG: hypothetical protein AB1898_28270 [Acidobacteriota bacterium]